MKLRNITTALLLIVATTLMAQDNVAKQEISPEKQKLMNTKQELAVQRGKVSSKLNGVNKQLRQGKGSILRSDKDVIAIQKQIQALHNKIDKIIVKKYPDVGALQKESKDLTEQFAEICSKQKDVIIELKKLDK